MIHQPSIHGNGIQGQASDIKIMSDYMQKNKKRLNRIMAENTGRTIEEITEATDRSVTSTNLIFCYLIKVIFRLSQ